PPRRGSSRARWDLAERRPGRGAVAARCPGGQGRVGARAHVFAGRARRAAASETLDALGVERVLVRARAGTLIGPRTGTLIGRFGARPGREPHGFGERSWWFDCPAVGLSAGILFPRILC